MSQKRCVRVTILMLAVVGFSVATVHAAPQASDLTARHEAGQTILCFKEAEPPAAGETISVADLRKLRQQLDKEASVCYRIYRSAEPIKSLKGLEPVAEVPPLSCFNGDYYGDPWSKKPAMRYVVAEGEPPLPPGTGVCAHNPKKAGEAYYAVTRVVDGEENTAVGPDNSLTKPIRETVGQGVPILQRVVKPDQWQYVKGPTLHYYVRWESPPNCAVQGKPIDYVVAVPPNPAKPAPVGIHLHCWGGSLNGGYGWWYQAEQGHLLVAANQVPYDWWTGYHEAYWDGPADKEKWEKGVVRPYSQTRMLSFLDWVATKWDVDLSRTHVAGNSMGGSGSPMFAIRHPDRIAWAVGWVGVHIPHLTPHFKGSYERVYGKPDWQIDFEDGTPVWDHFNDAKYLRANPRKEIGLIAFSNGKNDSGIGWAQAADFHRALQETRRPHIFVWGQSGHGQRARLPVSLDNRRMPMDLRIDQSQPAFTRCSLDDDPGSGDPKDGDAEGQSNLYLYWETDDVVDQSDRWEMTLALVDKAPKDECTVDVTPRRLQKFSPAAGQKVQWTNTSVASGKPIQTGQATVDEHGLITLEQVRVSKGGSRIAVVR